MKRKHTAVIIIIVATAIIIALFALEFARADDRAGDGADVAKPKATATPAPQTDGDWFEGWSVTKDGRPYCAVWKETSPGHWEIIYAHYTDMED